MVDRSRVKDAEGFLTSLPTKPPTFDSRAGQYRDGNGRFVSGRSILKLLDQEQKRLEARLKGHTRLLANGAIDLPEWQNRFIQSMKESHLQMAALSSGGKAKLTPQQFGAIGQLLRRQYQYLDRFARAMKEGKLTRDQAIYRSGLYASSIRPAFSQAEKIARKLIGFNQAMRSLDPLSRHCRSCLSYSTYGEWQPIDLVIPPGINCECQQKCRCSIVYRRFRLPR